MNGNKTVHLVSSRPRRDVQVQISPTDTASAVLEKAGLDVNDHYLIKPGDQTEFGMDETIYDSVSDNGKLNVVPQSNVGGSNLPDPPRGMNLFYTPPVLKSYSQDMGWTPRPATDGGITYEGYYRALGLRWRGRVTQTAWGALQFEIHNPPITYIRQSQWAGCFHPMTGDWMWITFRRHPTDVDSGVAAVNKILKSVYENRHNPRTW